MSRVNKALHRKLDRKKIIAMMKRMQAVIVLIIANTKQNKKNVSLITIRVQSYKIILVLKKSCTGPKFRLPYILAYKLTHM